MALDVTALHPRFGAELSGVRTCAEGVHIAPKLEQLVGQYGLVLIRGIELDDKELERLAGQFGSLQNLAVAPGAACHVIRVTNLTEEGAIKPVDEKSRARHAPNLLWHADSTFLSPCASLSFLHARIVPAEGGDTHFCDMRAAWDDLPEDLRSRLAPLYADHSMAHSWKLTGHDLESVGAVAMPVVRRRLAPVHEPSGRAALLIPSHVAAVEGFDEAQWLALQDELIGFATMPDKIYVHTWQVGDLLIWDNRCMLHRAAGYDDLRHPRDLRSCRVIDERDEATLLPVEA